jgi:putative nucleotide binding protein
MTFNRTNPREKIEQPRDEHAIVLDVILGSQSSFKDSELIQAIGTKAFTLLELVPKQGVILKSGDKVYIGEGKRDEIQYIKRAISVDKLSGSAKSELIFTIKDIILEREEEFINFFNNAGPITIRKHSLELVGGIGKKHLNDLIEERRTPFKNFEDIKERCTYLSDPAKSISQRILDEIEGKDDFKFFLRR